MSDDKPTVGAAAKMLGVRIGSGPNTDIEARDDRVRPGTGGMSVAPSVDKLPTHRLPRRLQQKYPDRFPDARGSNQLHCWVMGEGDFVAAPLTADLVLRPDPGHHDRHGFVEPDREMPVADYEAALTATREQWTRWEE